MEYCNFCGKHIQEGCTCDKTIKMNNAIIAAIEKLTEAVNRIADNVKQINWTLSGVKSTPKPEGEANGI